MKFVITIPMPPKELSPNGRTHWAKKARLVRAARTHAHVLALSCKHAGYGFPWSSATVTIEARFKTVRFQDFDNILASLKPSLDGFQDAGIVTDDNHFEIGKITRIKDKENPGITITIEKNED